MKNINLTNINDLTIQKLKNKGQINHRKNMIQQQSDPKNLQSKRRRKKEENIYFNKQI